MRFTTVTTQLFPELFFEDQKVESLRRGREWLKIRLPKHLEYWENVLQNNDEVSWLLGDTFTYADLVLFQVSFSSKFSHKSIARNT